MRSEQADKAADQRAGPDMPGIHRLLGYLWIGFVWFRDFLLEAFNVRVKWNRRQACQRLRSSKQAVESGTKPGGAASFCCCFFVNHLAVASVCEPCDGGLVQVLILPVSFIVAAGEGPEWIDTRSCASSRRLISLARRHGAVCNLNREQNGS